MGKKGLSVVELIVSFVLCILVFVFIIQVVSSVEELYINLGIKTELLNKQSLISEDINNRLSENDVALIKNCGTNCLTFFYKNNTSEKMTIDKEKNIFTFGTNSYSFSGLGFVDSLTINTNADASYGQGILSINLNVKNSIFDTGKYIIKALYQYNTSETVYSASNANKPEIILLGPATNYKFTEDLFVETGWIVYYPDGTITINENDVIPSEVQYDDDGNAYVEYKGVGKAEGEETTRFIKIYTTAKEHIIDLAENNPASGVYLYDGIGKYVYKGANPDNYISIGSKLFRIMSLDIQSQYVLDSNGEVLIENGNKVKEDVYLLKVVSEDYITDSEGNSIMPFGNARNGEPLFNLSTWSKTICTDPNDKTTCTIYRQYINSIVNDIWLQGLLNTGTGRLQIKNGTFNSGMIDWTKYYFGPNASNGTYTYPINEVYTLEGADVIWGDGVTIEPGKWHGDCLEDVCEPNAGIYSVTDVLLASSDENCYDAIISTMSGNLSVSCSNKNWLWKKANDGIYYRLMTRNTFTNTWLLTGTNFLLYNDVPTEYATRGTLYLDANLYIMGAGTIDSPYSLYSINK